jgi:PKD repeat protein
MSLEPLSWSWDFGDGETSTLRNPKHTYVMPGIYSVGLTVLFNNGTTSIVIKQDYIKVYDFDYSGDNPDASITDKCYRLPIYPSDGFGCSEYKDSDNTGFDWVWPCSQNGTAFCLDENKEEIALVLDTKTQQIFQVNDPDIWQDRVGNYNQGKDIDSEVWLRADHAQQGEHVAIRVTEDHFYFDPFDRDKRNTVGFDDVGFMSGMAVDVKWMLNGEPVIPSMEDKRIPKDGDIVTDAQLEGRSIQPRVKMHSAGYWLKGVNLMYETIDKGAVPSLKQMTETVNQENLVSMPLLYVSRNFSPLLNLATSANAVGTVGSLITGPDNTDFSAISFVAPNFGLADTLPEYLDADFTLKIWVNNITPITDIWNIAGFKASIIAGFQLQITDGVNPVITYPLTFSGGSWALITIVRDGTDLLCYEGTVLLGRTGMVVINYGNFASVLDNNSSSMEDAVILPRALTQAEIEYYYIDITQKNGLSTLPEL